MDRNRYRDDDRWRGRRDWDEEPDRAFNRGYPTDVYGGYRRPGRGYRDLGRRDETAYGASWNPDYDRGWDWHGRNDWDRDRWQSPGRDMGDRSRGMGERIRRGWDRMTDRIRDWSDRETGQDRDYGWDARDRDRETDDWDRGTRWDRDMGRDRDIESRGMNYDRGRDYDSGRDYDRGVDYRRGASYGPRGSYGRDREWEWERTRREGRDRDDYGSREREWLSSNRRGGWDRGNW